MAVLFPIWSRVSAVSISEFEFWFLNGDRAQNRELNLAIACGRVDGGVRSLPASSLPRLPVALLSALLSLVLLAAMSYSYWDDNYDLEKDYDQEDWDQQQQQRLNMEGLGPLQPHWPPWSAWSPSPG